MLSTADHIIEASRALQPSRTAPVVAGLPRVGGMTGVGAQNRSIGATKTVLSTPPPNLMQVSGQPSMRLLRGTAGSAIVVLDRFINNADLLSDDELVKPFETWAESVASDARVLMKGPLTRQRLRAMNNPYGRGFVSPRGRRRRGLGRIQGGRVGVSNLAVVNRQSGSLENSLSVVVRRFKWGVRTEWHYDTEYAAFLMMGTIRMRAHFPMPTAVVKNLQGVNAIARDAGRMAYFRNQAMKGNSDGN